jgi:uncharacterized protein
VSSTRLCIFARAPVHGAVKRRLARDIGSAAALAAYHDLVDDTLKRLAAVPGVVSELWLAGEPNEAVSRWCSDFDLPLRQQCGDDLGERMHHALSGSLELASRALLVGSDCQDIDAAYVLQADGLLHGVDVVFAPAEDGGYAMVGARRAARRSLSEVFREVPWGSAGVLEITLTRTREAGLSVAVLPTVWDVDTLSDWQRYLARRR